MNTSEFKLYKRISGGDLRPHLETFNSKDGLTKLRDEFYTRKIDTKGDILKFIEKAFDKDFHGLKDGNKYEIEINEENDPYKITISKVPNPNEDELINLDIPPPPDEKAHLFLRIIEDEFERIKNTFIRKFEQSDNLNDYKFYAIKNIQIAKNIAHESHLLGKKLNIEETDTWENANTYIIYVLKKYLIYAILEIQKLCKPILDFQIQNEHELEDELFEFEHTKMMSRFRIIHEDLNKKHIERLYSEIGENASIEKKIEFFKNKLITHNEKINNISKSKFGLTLHDIETKKLYEIELGKILSKYYLSKFLNKVDINIVDKYKMLMESVKSFRINSDSIETIALNETDFFDKIQIEIDLLKELINFSNSLPINQNLLRDLVSLLLVIQSRKHLKLDEDEWNDYLSDLLRVKQYYVADQSRSGRSGSSKKKNYKSGEMDISIRDKDNNGIIKTIIETLQLNSCGYRNQLVKNHIDKLIKKYDTAGNEDNFIIIFSTAKSFLTLWDKYVKYVDNVVFNKKSKMKEIEYNEISKSDLKIGLNLIDRNNKKLNLYHLFVNMYSE